MEHGDPFLASPVNELVVDVRDIDHPSDIVATISQKSLDRVKDDRADHVSNVCFRVDRWSAQIHAHFARLQRLERLFVLGERVVNSNRVGGHGGDD